MQEVKAVIKREFIGQVVSASMNKTVVVLVANMKMNTKYGKRFKVGKKYHVHDEKGEAKLGDNIKFVQCRPISKTKKWRLTEVVKANA